MILSFEKQSYKNSAVYEKSGISSAKIISSTALKQI
jgi:hypothetical protein